MYPPIDRPYFVTDDIAMPASSGLEPVKFDITLRRATWASGRVTDVTTSKPVANALIDYFPMLRTNAPGTTPTLIRLLAVRSQSNRTTGPIERAGSESPSCMVGEWSPSALNSEGIVPDSARRPSRGRSDRDQLMTYDHIYPAMYHGLREIDVPDGSNAFSCDVSLDPGGSIAVRLVDTAGKPRDNRHAERPAPRVDRPEQRHATVRASPISAGSNRASRRTLVAEEQVRKIGAVLTVPLEGSKDGDEITVTLRPNASLIGRVVDETGKPAGGYIQVRHIPAMRQFHGEINIRAYAKVDSDGRFRCDNVPPGGSYRVWLINQEGSMARVRMKSDAFQPFELADKLNVEPGQVVDLGTYNVATGKRIEPPAASAGPADVPITGRIVDLEGRPVAGVSVKVDGVKAPKTGDLTSWIEGVKKGEPPWIAYHHVDADVKIPDSLRRDATTDSDGRFRFDGLGRERVVDLTIKGDTVAYTSIDVVTRTTEPFPARGFPDTHGPGAQTVYGADFTYTANPGRPVEGVVLDAKTKQPMAGVSVQSWRFAGSDFVDTRQLKTVSDENGRFRIVGMPKGKGNVVIAIPSDNQPYFMREASVDDPPGIGPVPVEIELHRGVMITGRITDKSTGKPVAGARLHYLPFLENTFVQALPEFDKHGNVNGFQTRYTSGADGTYKLVGMPGRAIVGVESVDQTRTGAESAPKQSRGWTRMAIIRPGIIRSGPGGRGRTRWSKSPRRRGRRPSTWTPSLIRA